jgi:predicted GNAT family acetyltransferase
MGGRVDNEWPVVHDEVAHRFEVALGDEQAVLNYHRRNNALVITHTGVPRAWEGRGIAASMTRAAFEYARAQGLSIVPVCSYAAAYLKRNPEYGDLIKRD